MGIEQENQKKPKLKVFKEGDILFKEGEHYDEMFKMLSGSVEIYIRYGKPNEHLIGVLTAPACIGEWNLLSDSASSYTVVAYKNVNALCIARDSLETFIRNNPKNAIDIMRNMNRSMETLKTNVDMLLDELYEMIAINKQHENEVYTAIKQRMLRYSLEMPGVSLSEPFSEKV